VALPCRLRSRAAVNEGKVASRHLQRAEITRPALCSVERLGCVNIRDRCLRPCGEVGEVYCFSTVYTRVRSRALRRKRIKVHQLHHAPHRRSCCMRHAAIRTPCRAMTRSPGRGAPALTYPVSNRGPQGWLFRTLRDCSLRPCGEVGHCCSTVYARVYTRARIHARVRRKRMEVHQVHHAAPRPPETCGNHHAMPVPSRVRRGAGRVHRGGRKPSPTSPRQQDQGRFHDPTRKADAEYRAKLEFGDN
jgi:hypothetical protein